ncbi:MAG: class I SAM-dependent DNA methyltransferase [Ruminococcus sp.]|nr:class I SAM-dependent DNA methyltransferase [Ruminococcus sp.]
MSMDLTGINNQNEYYTNHYFSSIFEENASDTISKWRAEAKDNESVRTPWALLREAAKQYYPIHDRFSHSKYDTQTLANIRSLADTYLSALGYPCASPEWIELDDTLKAPVYLELKKSNGAPALWVMLAASEEKEAAILDKYCFSANDIGEEGVYSVPDEAFTAISNEDLITKILFGQAEPPRFIILIGMNQIALIDRNKWNEKRYLQFELEDIFSRHEDTTLQAMAVLLHHDNLCPSEGTALLDELDTNSQKHASGVSQDLKYALRESIELLGNEVLFDLSHRLGRDLDTDPVDAGQLTIECLRYMYRMLFVLFIEARPELGYAPIKAQSYLTGYSLESLRDIADNIRDDVAEVGSGYYLHETLAKLYKLIYDGYPESEDELIKYSKEESLHDMFVISPLKAHIFDPEYTPMITQAKLRNSVMLRIIDLMSLTRATGKRNSRRGRISYANLGINQMGSVYEALLSYRGFIAEHTLFEVKKAGDKFNELDVGYFVAESELDQYAEDERVRYEKNDPDGHYKAGDLRKYEKGTFIYRLAGREREKSASYYTPEVLTKCLVKYALKELLEGKTAGEILELTVCEPAMGSAAFLNEAINQLAEAYIDRKQRELGKMIPAEKRMRELQKVKMYIADRNVYGIDLNPIAVELAEVSLWLNTIYEGGYVPWFGTQLVNGNSLIGARRQVYREGALRATSKGLRWYENEPERLKFNGQRRDKIYHFLLGDPGMCNYTDKVIKSLEPEYIKKMKQWNKDFNKPYTELEIAMLKQLSGIIDALWKQQITNRKVLEKTTRDNLSVYGQENVGSNPVSTIREKDNWLSLIYKSEGAKNAGSYARLKFAMDYWCALWFWPIQQADLLPTRSEFLNEMNFILMGVMDTTSSSRQLSVFGKDEEQEFSSITAQNIVDINQLCALFPRLALVRDIAAQNHFMHWELEFADLFAERGGFDLILGNPPWEKLTWTELGILSDHNPLISIRKWKAPEIAKIRNDELKFKDTLQDYYIEYQEVAGSISFYNAIQNYSLLAGQQTNIYKCFLPQAWCFANQQGTVSFIHQNGVFDDPNGGMLRKEIYHRLRKHFRFINKFLLFDISTSREFSINIYHFQEGISFDCIYNLFSPATVDDCYDKNCTYPLYGLKDKNNKWCLTGNPERIINVTKQELLLFSRIYDNSDNWDEARLPIIHAQPILNVLKCFSNQNQKISDLNREVVSSVFWDETNAPLKGIIKKNIHFPECEIDVVLSGNHIGVANPLFKSSRRNCKSRYDFDIIDLTNIPDNYLQRCNYSPNEVSVDYYSNIPNTNWGTKITAHYKFVARKMLNLPGDRTFMGCILPPNAAHINGIIGLTFQNEKKLVSFAGSAASIPFDFFIKLIGKPNLYGETLELLPLFEKTYPDFLIRTLRLNCVSKSYSQLWENQWEDSFLLSKWSKKDSRLKNDFSCLSSCWEHNSALRTDYSRRAALIEIDVLTAMMMGMPLETLISILRIYFPVLLQNESDTWYDANGRIVFTTNTTLTNVGFSRTEWENGIKGAPAGQKFYRTITDDTMPGGPVERTIEYVAPFDRCDREQDYETAWRFFEEKYGENL